MYHGIVREPRDWKDIADGARKSGRRLAAVIVVTATAHHDADIERARHQVAPILIGDDKTIVPSIMTTDTIDGVIRHLKIPLDDIIGVFISASATGSRRKRAFADITKLWPLNGANAKLVPCPHVRGDVVIGVGRTRRVWTLGASDSTPLVI